MTALLLCCLLSPAHDSPAVAKHGKLPVVAVAGPLKYKAVHNCKYYVGDREVSVDVFRSKQRQLSEIEMNDLGEVIKMKADD